MLSHDSFALLGHLLSNVMYCKGDIYVHTHIRMYAYVFATLYLLSVPWLQLGGSLHIEHEQCIDNAEVCHPEELAQNEVYFVHREIPHTYVRSSCSCCNKTCFRPTTHCVTTASCNTSASSLASFAGS